VPVAVIAGLPGAGKTALALREHAMRSMPARTLSALPPAIRQTAEQTTGELVRVQVGRPVRHDDHLAPARALGLVEGRVGITDQLGQGTP